MSRILVLLIIVMLITTSCVVRFSDPNDEFTDNSVQDGVLQGEEQRVKDDAQLTENADSGNTIENTGAMRKTDTAIRGVFPLVRKSQAFEWNNGWQVTDEVEEMLQQDYVSGITFYLAWSDFEPEQGEYKWTFINQLVTVTKKYNKTMHLGIASAQFSPEWLRDNVEYRRFYLGHRGVAYAEAPLPWDTMYLKHYFTMVHELGNRLEESPQFYSPVTRIVMGGPTNSLGFEMVLSGHPDDQEYYKNKGYPERFIDAWKQVVDEYDNAIPQDIELNFVWHRGMRGDWSNRHAEEVVQYMILKNMQHRVNLMSLGLKGYDWWDFDGPPHPDGDPTKEKEMLAYLQRYSNEAFGLGYQMGTTGYSEDFGNYGMALGNAIDMDALWVEPWAEDILDNRTGTTPHERRIQLLTWTNKQLKK